MQILLNLAILRFLLLYLLMVLAASAYFDAVPALLRFVIPEINPSLYFDRSLGMTVPMNILLGLPLYARAV